MQNPIQNFRQSSIVFEKRGILSGKLKDLTSSNYHRVRYFLLKLRKRLLRTNFYQRVPGTFLFCFDLELFAKNRKGSVSTQSFFLHFYEQLKV